MNTYIIEINDDVFEYQASTIKQAKELFLDSFKGYATIDCIDAIYQINENELIKAIGVKSGYCVFEDSYGTGIAIVESVVYNEWWQLAQAMGLHVRHFDSSLFSCKQK
jgi:hypothetical protein